MIVCYNNTNGNGYVKCVTVIERVIFSRSFYYDKLHVVLNFVTRSFINVKRISQKLNGYVQLFTQFKELFFLKWRHKVYPYTTFRFIYLYSLVVNIFEVLYHVEMRSPC